MIDVEGMLDMSDLWAIHKIDGHKELRDPVLDARQPADVHRDGWREAGPLRRDPPRRPARAPSVRLLRQQRRALRRAGGRRSERARDQGHGVPDLGRLEPHPAAGPGRRARQAGGGAGGAQGTLRRAGQHRVGAGAGRGGRPRGARAAGVEDAREGAACGAARGKWSAALPPRGNGQLPRPDRPALRGLRALHHRPRDHDRRGRPLQLPHRRRAGRRVREGDRGARPPARPDPRRDPAHGGRRTRPASRRAS